MNKKYVNIALVSLLFCAVHNNSKGKSHKADAKSEYHPYVVYASPEHSKQRTLSSKQIAALVSTVNTLKSSCDTKAISKKQVKVIIAENAGRFARSDKDDVKLENSSLDVVGRLVCSFIVDSAKHELLHQIDKKHSDFEQSYWLKKMNPEFLTGQRENVTLFAGGFASEWLWNRVKKSLVSRGWAEEAEGDNS